MNYIVVGIAAIAAYFIIGLLIAGFVTRHEEDEDVKPYLIVIVTGFYPLIFVGYIVLVPAKFIYSCGEKIGNFVDRIKTR